MAPRLIISSNQPFHHFNKTTNLSLNEFILSIHLSSLPAKEMYLKNTNKYIFEIEIKQKCRNWRQSDGWMSPPLRELGHRWPCPPKVGGRGLRRLVFVGDLVHLWCKHLWYLSIYSIHLSTHIYSMYHLSSLLPYCLLMTEKGWESFLPHVHVRTPKLRTFPVLRMKLPLQKDLSAPGLWSREITGGY